MITRRRPGPSLRSIAFFKFVTSSACSVRLTIHQIGELHEVIDGAANAMLRDQQIQTPSGMDALAQRDAD